jgi:hypothetical protein
MGKIEERLDRLEDRLVQLGISGEQRAADMSPAERQARIIELDSKELGLDHVMTQLEHEDWLLREYQEAAYGPVMPKKAAEDASVREQIEALRANEAWWIVQVRRAQAEAPKQAEKVGG